MSVRKLIAGLAGATMVISTWSMLAVSPAHAEPAFTPDANDIVGVGSDTTMNAMHFIAEGVEVNGEVFPGYNDLIAPNPADAQLASYDAFGVRVADDCPEVPAANRPAHPVAGEVVPCVKLRSTSPNLWRPNGSGNGKRALYQAMTGPGADPNTKADDISVGGAEGNPEVDFARSSAPITGSAEIAANLWAFPFALDGFKPAVRNAGTNAPAVISEADFLKIYKGEFTDWSQLGGQPGTIHPLVPQPGSGTYQVFNTKMTTLNGGDAQWNTNPNSAFAQEHDDTLIKNDPNAVAPFSTGRAKALAATVRILDGGWSVDRALFNVVRNSGLDDQFVADLFDTSGFLCSAEAQPLIEAAGFLQLAPPSAGGICGEATQATPSNFTTSPERTTETDLAAASPAAETVTLTATVNETGQPVEGSVEFVDLDTGTPVGNAVVAARQATVTLTGVPAGVHRYRADFTPDDALYTASASPEASVTVAAKPPARAKPAISESFGPSVKKGTTTRGVVTVKPLAGASGKVAIFERTRKLATKTLSGGKASFALKFTKKGKHTLKIKYAGSATLLAGTKAFTITVK